RSLPPGIGRGTEEAVVCERISELRAAMAVWAAAFDPALVSATDAARVVEEAAAIEHMAATIKALAAVRVADTDLWRAGGDRSAAHHLARTTGASLARATEALATARHLEVMPSLAQAARRGELSAAQTAVIADAVGVAPAAESRLLERARAGASLPELSEDCA